MAGNNFKTLQSRVSLTPRSPELQDVARQVASLALAKVEQDGSLSIRQREQLRRAFSAAGDTLGWTRTVAMTGEPAKEVRNDVMSVSKRGAKLLAGDLADELEKKRSEVAQLEKIASLARELAENPETSYPTDVSYSYTTRDASQELVTRTETLTLNNAQEMHGAADTIEKTIAGRGKLTDLMINDLEEKRERLDLMTRTLPDFLKSSHGLLREVVATLE
jgi:hypothetical protein